MRKDVLNWRRRTISLNGSSSAEAVMRTVMLAVGMLIALSGPGFAQESEQLPPINVLGKRPPPTNDCSKLPAGSKQNLDCLNRQLKRDLDRVSPPSINVPASASSPDTQIGIVNLPAVQQQYGQSYGHSVIPFRPPAPSFGTPLGHH
jgi:hypothetical protein